MSKKKHHSQQKHVSNQKAKPAGAGIPRKYAWIGGLVLVVVGLLAFATTNQKPVIPFTPEVTGEPRAELDQTELDYGDVVLNTTLNSVFTVRNIGDQPLEILGEPVVELIEGC